MPSPFPGMDPYLEAQGLWRDVHAKLINYIQEALSDQLPEAYEARIDERETWIEIRRLADRRVVTVIEVLSPTNKLGYGFARYKDKRRELLERDVHVVEIDMLIAGNRLPIREALPAGHFFAFLARAHRRPRCEVYAWGLRQPLPTLPIPLHEPDPDIPLDVAAVFATVYERGRYRRALDYTAALPADWPLAAGDRAWAESLGHRESESSAGGR